MLTYSKAIYGELEKKAVRRALDSGRLSNGKETVMFEKEFAKWWGIKYAVAVSSGSTADILALQALDLSKGSEVITTPGACFPTTVTAMLYLGLKPVFVDLEWLTIFPNWIEKAIGPDTKAIMFAHTLGFMPNMSEIMAIAEKHKLKVVEDCCDAVGSKQNGEMAGTFGDVATVSFYPAHHMTTCEGGMVLTNNYDLYREAISIRDWGRDCVCQYDSKKPVCGDRFKNPPFDHRYYYTRIGSNFKMSEMQAAFGREQLKRLDKFIKLRKRNFAILADIFGDCADPDISPFAYPLFSRDKQYMMTELYKAGIDSRVMFGGNILKHPAFKDIDCRIIGEMTESDIVLNQGYFVGVGPHLTKEDMKYIGGTICRLKRKKSL